MSEVKVKPKQIVFGGNEEKEENGVKYVTYDHNTYVENCPVDKDTLQEVLNYSKEYSERSIDLAVKEAGKYFEEDDDANELHVTYPMYNDDAFKVSVMKEKEIDGEVSSRVYTEMKVDSYDHREHIIKKEKALNKIIAEI